MDRKKVYISFDVETDGPCPYNNNCIQMGFAVINDVDGTLVDINNRTPWLLETRSWCLKPLDGHIPSEGTMSNFWSKHKEIYEMIQKNSSDVKTCMIELSNWVKLLQTKFDIIWIAKPASFDWQWLNSYYNCYGPDDRPSIGYKATCISSQIDLLIAMGYSWYDIEKAISPPESKDLIVHCADHDAVVQGYNFLKLRSFALSKKK